MKTTTFSAIVTALNTAEVMEAIKANCPDIDAEAMLEEVNSENAAKLEKKQANKDAYSAAKAPVFAVLSTTPQTVQDIFDACKPDLPEGFTKNKVQYALLNYWRDEIIVTDNGKNPKTYSTKSAD